jgi:tetratricopeptide (TPR) repeat protein
MTFDDLFEEEDDAGLVNLLADLFPGQESLLFHLLVCSPCRDRATTGLLARYGTSLVLPVGGLTELLGDGCDPDFPVDGWVDELLAHPREHHFDLLDEPRFGDGLLVQPLLERCQGEQLRDPELAEHLALLAVRLAGKALDDAGLQKAMVRTSAALANTRRLAGKLDDALQMLGEPSVPWVPRVDQARFWRAAALVRWEQGGLETAMELLQEAARLFSTARLLAEEGETLTLLGLVQREAGLLPQSMASLLSGLQLLPPQARHWLAARGCLTLAADLAELGNPEDASRLLEKGWQHIPRVEDSAEAAFLYGFYGAVLGMLGELERACGLLRPARIRHLSEARLPEAALASLDLALVLADLGRISEIEPLAVELVERFPGEAAAAAARTLRDIPWTEPDGLRRKVEAESQTLRRTFRLAGPRPRPLPFA